MSAVFTFRRLNDAEEQKSFLAAVEDLPKGPLTVSLKLRHEAGELLARAARDHAAKFGRESATPEDFKVAATDNPALLRICVGDVTSDPNTAQVA